MPRPRSLSDTKQYEVCAMVACGCTLQAAAQYACCSVVTIRREARRNPEFHERLRKATIQAQVTPVNVLHDFACRDWKAAAWLLERTHPERFAKRPACTYTEAQVADLLGRVCDVFRRALADKEKFARVKRRVQVLFAATLPQDGRTDKRRSRPAKSRIASPAPHSNCKDAHMAEQNETIPQVVLSRATDLPPGNSSEFATADATKPAGSVAGITGCNRAAYSQVNAEKQVAKSEEKCGRDKTIDCLTSCDD
jgi:hypothetical protein